MIILVVLFDFNRDTSLDNPMRDGPGRGRPGRDRTGRDGPGRAGPVRYYIVQADRLINISMHDSYECSSRLEHDPCNEFIVF